MQLAHALPLADDKARQLLADELAQRGFLEAAQIEDQLIWKTGPWVTGHYEIPSDELIDDNIPLEGFFARADIHERVMLGDMLCLAIFSPAKQAFFVPHHIHWLRLRGHLAANDLDRALAEARLCLNFLPGNIQAPSALAAALDKGGRRHEADELFNRVYNFLDDVVKEFPRYAEGRNDLARLAARCGRRLEEGLTHARKAVELEPKNTGYLATLAETRWARGEREQAVEVMKQCIKLDDKNTEFQKRLKEFEAALTPCATGAD